MRIFIHFFYGAIQVDPTIKNLEILAAFKQKMNVALDRADSGWTVDFEICGVRTDIIFLIILKTETAILYRVTPRKYSCLTNH